MDRSRPLRSNPEQVLAWRRRAQARLRARGGLPKVGASKRRQKAAEARFRRALQDRSGGWCEILSPACPAGAHAGVDPHHLCHADRDRGVHDPARGLWVCRAAHDWIETHPQESYRLGWLIRDDGGPAT